MLQYFKDSFAELKHVSFPTRSQALWFTVLVVLLSGLVGYGLGLLDGVFAQFLEKFVL